ncbi:RHS repeat-associated core domain-containing protein [Aquilutibacter rugosus]|uniref:RHS repeat-associated core domain-containing protein n=1 Tax=Aquilutibacter rugosus TaxID=3115820 RepID=UPI002F424CF1
MVTLSFDVQGNLSSKYGQAHTFDFGNRLRAVSGVEVSHYDAAGRRVTRWPSTGDGLMAMYTADNAILYAENHRAAVRKRFSYVHLQGSLLATYENNIDTNANAWIYQHTDAIGSPVATTNAAGTVTERTNYEPWGAALGKPTIDQVGYTGHQMDGSTGLIYMQQRYYDPNNGRFLSTDPVQANANTGGGFNRYAYAANNPYKFTDPDGRQERAYGAGASLMMTPEQRRIWEAGERAATTQGSGAVQGAAAMDGIKQFVANPQITKVGAVQLAATVGAALLTRGNSSGPMHGPSPRINLGQQGKHQLGHYNYQPGRSVLTAEPSELGRHAGTGQQVGKIEIGLPGSKERVNFGQNIGRYIDPQTGVSSPTTNVMISYGKDGIHIWPVRPTNEP